MTAREAFVSARDMLLHSGAEEPEARARVIVAHALGTEYHQVYSDIGVSDKELRGHSIHGFPVREGRAGGIHNRESVF